MGFAKPIEQYLFCNLLTKIHGFMYLKDIIRGIMSMARYHYTRENENGVVLYLESEPAEDAMDEFDDEIAVGFSGNGYLRFWTRC